MFSRRGLFGFLFGAAAAVPAITKGLSEPGALSAGNLSALDADFGNIMPVQRWQVLIDAAGKVTGLIDLMPSEPLGSPVHTLQSDTIEYDPPA